jgi:hypothetical protein
MVDKMGDPESGQGSIGDRQIERARFHFQESLYAKGNRKRLDAIEAHAAEMIRRDRPRGGPR